LVALSILFPLFASAALAQTNLKLLGHLDPFEGENRYADVWGEGNYAYLGSFSGSGVMIVDISDPTNPRLAGHYNPAVGGRFQDVVVIDGVGYFSSEDRGGLHIVDVHDPANPFLLSQITQAQNGFLNVHELFVSKGVLYEADSRTNRVKAFDVRNPANPIFLWDIVTTDALFIHAITVVNDRLFTSGWSGQTDIYDVRNILNQPPAILGSVNSGNSSHAAWMSSDGQLMVSARETIDGDIRLFDISDPANPVQLSAITAKSVGLEAFSAHNPYIVGNLLFVSWYQAGALVFDITDPRFPRLTGRFDTPHRVDVGFNGCWGIYPFLGFHRILVSDLDGGLYILDATEALAGPVTVSAASYSVAGVAAKSIVTAFGTDLTSSTSAAVSLPLPLTLSGAAVSVEDAAGVVRAAALFYASPTQINFQIPAETAIGPAVIKFQKANGETLVGASIVQTSAPSIFTYSSNGLGAAAAIDASTGERAPFSASQANGLSTILAVFGTGLGNDATDLPGNVAADTRATVDGIPCLVGYAGQAPGFIGLNQFNLYLPTGLTTGDHTLIINRHGVASNPVIISLR
jgi:uncharacterized protein (TIGR03437 family)